MPHATSEPEVPDPTRVAFLVEYLLTEWGNDDIDRFREEVGGHADAQNREEARGVIEDHQRQLSGLAGFTDADLTAAMLFAPQSGAGFVGVPVQ